MLRWATNLTPAEALVEPARARPCTIAAVLCSQVAHLESVIRPNAALEHGDRPEDLQWKILTATLVFLMQLGFAMIDSGMCRQVLCLDVACVGSPRLVNCVCSELLSSNASRLY